MPQRIQMSRSHPWRAEHPDAVIVDRRTKWGNPFRVERRGGQWLVIDNNGITYPEPWQNTRRSAVEDAVGLFYDDVTYFQASRITADEIRAELTGRDLACWCPLDQPCHADVLLALANGVA